MTTDVDWLGLLFMVVLIGIAGVGWRRAQPRQPTTPVAAHLQRLLKPRTPDDCSACRQRACTVQKLIRCTKNT